MLGPRAASACQSSSMPPLMNNHGNYVGSLANVCRWLGAKAEALGVEIYPGFAAAELFYGDKGEVLGIVTGDMGIGRDGEQKDSLYPRHGAARQVHACSPKARAARCPSC